MLQLQFNIKSNIRYYWGHNWLKYFKISCSGICVPDFTKLNCKGWFFLRGSEGCAGLKLTTLFFKYVIFQAVLFQGTELMSTKWASILAKEK